MSAASRSGRRRDRRRAVVLVAALVVGMSALLVATGLLFAVQADAAGAAWRRRDATLRSLALSGVRAVAAELDGQRERILAGEPAECPSSIEVWERDGRLGLVRLLPVGSSGAHLVPENGKLDLNRVSAADLEATGLVEPETAAAIVRAREARGSFSSLQDLLAVPGIAPSDVYGPLEAIDWSDAALGPDEDLGERIAARLGETDDAATLGDLLTVHAVEPLLQRNGTRRIGLDVAWSDELGRRIDERYGDGASNVIKQIVDGGFRFQGDAAIVQQLRRFDVEPDEWGEILDGLTGHRGVVHLGALDVNLATPAALRGAGLTPEQTAAIVDARDGVAAELRHNASWVVAEGLVPEEAYGALVDRLTARSWCWRVRVAAVEVDAEDGRTVRAGPVVLEAVIDLAEPTARLAELRDVTFAQLAAGLSRAGADDALALSEDDETLGGASDPGEVPGDAGDSSEAPVADTPSVERPRANRPSRPSVNRPRRPGAGGGDGDGDDDGDDGVDPNAPPDADDADAGNDGADAPPAGPPRVSRWRGPGGS